MRSTILWQRGFISLAIVVIAFVVTQTASRADGLTTCNNTSISTSFTMTDDYETSDVCFDITWGGTLNMNGKKITCSDGSCSTAIKNTSGYMIGEVNGSGTIEGNDEFAEGVKNVAVVRNITITDVPKGIIGAYIAYGNVVTGATEGITYLQTNSAYDARVYENWVDVTGASSWGIYVDSETSAGANVNGNVVKIGGGCWGLIIDGPGSLPVERNAIVGDDLDFLCGPILDLSLSAALENNACDEPTACPAPSAPYGGLCD